MYKPPKTITECSVLTYKLIKNSMTVYIWCLDVKNSPTDMINWANKASLVTTSASPTISPYSTTKLKRDISRILLNEQENQKIFRHTFNFRTAMEELPTMPTRRQPRDPNEGDQFDDHGLNITFSDASAKTIRTVEPVDEQLILSPTFRNQSIDLTRKVSEAGPSGMQKELNVDDHQAGPSGLQDQLLRMSLEDEGDDKKRCVGFHKFGPIGCCSLTSCSHPAWTD